MALALEHIGAAHARIRDKITRTPVMTSETSNTLAGAQLFFKCENLQNVGAFKARGAANAVFSLTGEEARRGVVTHSSGNHAKASARSRASEKAGDSAQNERAEGSVLSRYELVECRAGASLECQRHHIGGRHQGTDIAMRFMHCSPTMPSGSDSQPNSAGVARAHSAQSANFNSCALTRVRVRFALSPR
jgi:hypothetical protein